MAVNKQTYSVSPTWTPAQIASALGQAFIDAGLMTAWYDSFLNTVENRILEIQYDNTKTYGKTYYWFQFTTTGIYIHVALGWNAVTHVPTGTVYLDYYSTSTNTVTNHYQIITLSSTTQTNIIRYTSSIDTSYTWFLIRNGTNNFNFFIPTSAHTLVSWLDLNKVNFQAVINIQSTTNTYASIMGFVNVCPVTRRSYLSQGSLRANTSSTTYYSNFKLATHRYIGLGNASNSTSNLYSTGTGIVVPIGFNNTNDAYTTDVNPVFAGAGYYSYINELLPADLGFSFHYANNTMAVQDTLVVSAGVEEWEMIHLLNNSFAPPTGASPMFLARVV
jgi:hypothetical protein